MVERVVLYLGAMIAAALAVAWFCTTNDQGQYDSPFTGPTFIHFLGGALVLEMVIGVPYGLLVRAILRRLGKWNLATMLLGALVPALAWYAALPSSDDARWFIGACLAIAGVVMALGWHLVGFDRERWDAGG